MSPNVSHARWTRPAFPSESTTRTSSGGLGSCRSCIGELRCHSTRPHRVGLEDTFLERARPTAIGGTIVPLIDPEDLVIAKVLAGRPKDVEDARSLWRLRGHGFNAERVRETLRLLEGVLGQSDLLPCLETILRHAAKDVRTE